MGPGAPGLIRGTRTIDFMLPRIDGLRVLELGSPGEMRTRLNALVLAGQKTATAGIFDDYETDGEDLERPGERLHLVDDDLQSIGLVEVTAVEVVPMAEITWSFAQAEGEGFTSIGDWAEAHTRFWTGFGVEVNDATSVSCIHFRLVETDERGVSG